MQRLMELTTQMPHELESFWRPISNVFPVLWNNFLNSTRPHFSMPWDILFISAEYPLSLSELPCRTQGIR